MTLGQPTPPAGWSTPSGGGLNLVTDITVDTLGRTTLVLGPWHTIDIAGVATSIRRATFFVYQDGLFQTWVGQGYATASVGNGLRAVPDVVQPPSAGIRTAHLLPLPPGAGRGEGAFMEDGLPSPSPNDIDGLGRPSSGEGGLPLIRGDTSSYSFTLINPVSITITDQVGRATDQIQAIRNYTAGSLVSTDTFPQSSYCRWSTIQWTDCCKQASMRKYFLIPAIGTGTLGVNYWETDFGYDPLNRRNRVVGAEGTITRTVFDARNLPVSTWIGTNDTGATWLDPTGGGTPGNNMVMVSSNVYDNNEVSGDGNRTAVNQYVDASTVRTTQMGFDWRNRPVQTTPPLDNYSVTTLDNMSRAIQNAQYAQPTGNLIRLGPIFERRPISVI